MAADEVFVFFFFFTELSMVGCGRQARRGREDGQIRSDGILEGGGEVSSSVALAQPSSSFIFPNCGSPKSTSTNSTHTFASWLPQPLPPFIACPGAALDGHVVSETFLMAHRLLHPWHPQTGGPILELGEPSAAADRRDHGSYPVAFRSGRTHPYPSSRPVVDAADQLGSCLPADFVRRPDPGRN